MRKTRIEKLQIKFPNLTKDVLYEQYVVQQKSLPMLYKEYGIDFRASSDLLRYYNIPIRTISESRLTEQGKKRILKLFKEKHGVENPSQLDWVQKKKEETFKKHYGVDNIWKSKEYYQWLTDYMLIHYGVKRIAKNPWGWQGEGKKRKEERIKKLWSGRDKWWNSLNDEERSQIAARLCSLNTSSSKLETRVGDALNRLHISYKRLVQIGVNNFDFKIENSNILIEVNGDFWHANPKKYKEDDLVSFPNGPIKASLLWKKDERKRLTALKKGYKLLVIWENDLKKMTDEQLDTLLSKEIICD